MTTHIAVAKILSAYVYITLVDLFGDVPQTEALDGPSGTFSPTANSGSDVYAYAISLLNEARTELAKTGTDAGAALARDVYYNGDRTKWTALANTLELKAWVNISTLASRKAEANTKIASLLGSNIIDTDAENFAYTYSATTVPDSRHPLYNQYYGVISGGAGGYIGTSFMYELYWGKPDPGGDPTKSIQDPRWRYYLSRQAGSIETIRKIDQKALGCTPEAPPPAHYNGYPFCAFDPGFYGRDHGDASGTPPDGPTITAAGVYPAGGRPDNANKKEFESKTIRGDGANGAGIMPIYMSFFTEYLKAEILARNGDEAGAKTQLRTAALASISYVKKFADGKKQSVTTAPWTAGTWTYTDTTFPDDPDGDCKDSAGKAIDGCAFNKLVASYLTAVDKQYTDATTKLHVIGKEYWLATWGNGMEAYNSYRRTGGPDHLQPPLQQNAGIWQRSLIYSSNYVNLNGNAKQKEVDAVNKVFWDGNPETLN